MQHNLPSLMIALASLAVLSSPVTTAFAQGTAFTYQGRLNVAGAAASGAYDLTFAVFDTNQPAGNLIAGPLTNSATAVSNGLFTVTLDFGTGVFTGPARWLEIAARTNGTGSFSPLAPRQQLTPTPYAVFANTASNVLGSVLSSQISGVISPAQLPPNVITNQQLGVTLGGAFSGNGGALTNLNASQLTTGTVPTNVLAGFQAPYYAVLGGGQNNTANNTYAVVSGGANNNASYLAAAGGGYNNNAGGFYSTIPGGQNNTASGQDSFAAGQNAQALHQGAFVWADSQPGLFASTANDTFNVRADGGVNFLTRDASVTVNGSKVATLANLGNYWQTTGNAGTSPANGNFLGTTDNQPLELWVNNTRALRLEPDSSGNGSPNVIAGSPANFAAPGIYGAVIGGGGGTNLNDTYSNTVSASFAVIGGGIRNSVSTNSTSGTVGGGFYNTIGQVAGYTTIGGGYHNTIGLYDEYSTVAGGYENTISPDCGGSTIGGGSGNTLGTYASYSTIAGGYENNANAIGAFIGGGGYDENDIFAVSGNVAGGVDSAVVAGFENRALSDYAFIGGGQSNLVDHAAAWAAIAGGEYNAIATNAIGSFIGSGADNFIGPNADYSIIGGGFDNGIGGSVYPENGDLNVIGGGDNNQIDAGAVEATIGGDVINEIYGNALYATIPGGYGNLAGGMYSFAAGQEAAALHQGAFVWADSQQNIFPSTGNDQFCIRAQGGVQLDPTTSLYFGSVTRQMVNLYGTGYGMGVQAGTVYQRSGSGFAWFKGGVHNNTQNNPGNGGSVLMTLSSGGLTVNGTLASTSDRNAKEDFALVDSADVLARVAAMPITKWVYKTDTATRHIGPMAQDFYAAFAVGPDDKHITTVDEGGVALAAIQGLNQKLDATRAENAELKRRLEALESLLHNRISN